MSNELTPRQLQAIPVIIACPTITEGCEKAQVDRTTFYDWLKQPEFKAELDRQRREVVQEAFNTLGQGLNKAVEVLTSLLDTPDDRLRRLAANDIIEHILTHTETAELERRLAVLEERLLSQE
jgi:hypothetical protein